MASNLVSGRVHIRVLTDNTHKITAAMERRGAALVAKAAHDIEGHAKAGIQAHGLIDTGHMLNSVVARRLAPMRWVIEVGAHYGIYHEMGTRYLPARPFLYPAADLVRPQFFRAWGAIFAGGPS